MTTRGRECWHPPAESCVQGCGVPIPRRVEAASADQLKVITTADGTKSIVMVERIGYRQCFTQVRAFYLDLPGGRSRTPPGEHSGPPPCPIGQEISRRKFQRHPKARRDAQIRERLPVLPVLMHIADARRKNAAASCRPPARAHPGRTSPPRATS